MKRFVHLLNAFIEFFRITNLIFFLLSNVVVFKSLEKMM